MPEHVWTLWAESDEGAGGGVGRHQGGLCPRTRHAGGTWRETQGLRRQLLPSSRRVPAGPLGDAPFLDTRKSSRVRPSQVSPRRLRLPGDFRFRWGWGGQALPLGELEPCSAACGEGSRPQPQPRTAVWCRQLRSGLYVRTWLTLGSWSGCGQVAKSSP